MLNVIVCLLNVIYQLLMRLGLVDANCKQGLNVVVIRPYKNAANDVTFEKPFVLKHPSYSGCRGPSFIDTIFIVNKDIMFKGKVIK